MISEFLHQEIEKLVHQPLDKIQSVAGGSINQAAEITTEDGRHYFLKWNGSAPSDMFPKEEKGLELLRSAGSGLRLPEVIGNGATDEGTAFILMEHLQEGAAGSDSARRLGEGLAALHQITAERYGLEHDNYIGRLPQSNAKHDGWIDFFIDERLEPQLQMAIDAGKLSGNITKNFQRLYKKLPEILATEPASLLHGDLWSGNFMYDSHGHPTIYDPALYYGNREIELAMTHLFGGFSSEFYAAYERTFPLQSGFNERKDMYNLYPLLVHTNMFGGSYARRVEGTVKRF